MSRNHGQTGLSSPAPDRQRSKLTSTEWRQASPPTCLVPVPGPGLTGERGPMSDPAYPANAAFSCPALLSLLLLSQAASPSIAQLTACRLKAVPYVRTLRCVAIFDTDEPPPPPPHATALQTPQPTSLASIACRKAAGASDKPRPIRHQCQARVTSLQCVYAISDEIMSNTAVPTAVSSACGCALDSSCRRAVTIAGRPHISRPRPRTRRRRHHRSACSLFASHLGGSAAEPEE